MANFKKGDRIAMVRKVKETGRVVETIRTGVITTDEYVVEKHKHYNVKWDITNGEKMNMVDGIGIIALPNLYDKPKYDYIKI